jgi:hypothetical protein
MTRRYVRKTEVEDTVVRLVKAGNVVPTGRNATPATGPRMAMIH